MAYIRALLMRQVGLASLTSLPGIGRVSSSREVGSASHKVGKESLPGFNFLGTCLSTIER
jgi:hypothetical protein